MFAAFCILLPAKKHEKTSLATGRSWLEEKTWILRKHSNFSSPPCLQPKLLAKSWWHPLDLTRIVLHFFLWECSTKLLYTACQSMFIILSLHQFSPHFSGVSHFAGAFGRSHVKRRPSVIVAAVGALPSHQLPHLKHQWKLGRSECEKGHELEFTAMFFSASRAIFQLLKFAIPVFSGIRF